MENDILVVDDDPGVVRIITKTLEKKGYSVDSAVDGAQALELATKKDYDLIICDVVMPHMSGLQFFDSVKKVKPDTSIILVSGYSSFNYVLSALNMGAVAFLVKPFDNIELLKWVNRVMNLQRERHARELLFKGALINVHEVELETAAIMQGSNIYVISAYIARQLTDETDVNKVIFVKVELSIHEAIRNAAEHGNLELPSSMKPQTLEDYDENPYEKMMAERLNDPKYGKRKIIIRYTRTDGRRELKIRDEGKGFNHRVLPDPTSEYDSSYGRGFLLIRAGMDEVSYNDSGNEITLTRHTGA